MNKFRTKIIIALASFILLILFCLGFLLGQLFKSFYVHTFQERLAKEADLIEYMFQEKTTLSVNFKEEVNDIAHELNAGIVVSTQEGKTVLHTGQDDETLNDVQAFISEQMDGIEELHRMDAEKNLFYYVKQIDTQYELLDYLVLIVPVDSLEETIKRIWMLLSFSLGIAFIMIMMLGIKIINQYTRPIEAATRVANELARRNYKARTYEDQIGETGMLSSSINILARNLQQMTSEYEMQQDRLRTLIENMGSSLILIDGKGYINLINRTYRDTFNVNPNDYLYRLYYEAFEHKDVVEIVEQIFMTEVKVRKQLQLPLKLETKHFEVYGAPIIGLNEEWKGVVLVFHDITELKRLEQTRKDFVANVSHELKTPMTSIKGFSETLLDGAVENKELSTQFLNIILKESERLQSLVTDLLDLSKIEQEGFTLNLTKVNVTEILSDVLVILDSKASEKGVQLIGELHKEVYIIGDLHRVKQIFINLISNAVNYTPEKGKVFLRVSDKDDSVEVVIKDTGIGMSPEQLPRIFERFYRIDKARSRNSGGTGLGLAIVKHLVEAHHGKIDVHSQENQGTTFSVCFPKKFET